MLSGALDAQARVARRVYNITKVGARRTSFRNADFLDAIRTAGGQALADTVTGTDFREVQRFLAALRNSVHSIGLRGLGVSRQGHNADSSLVRVFEDERDVWEASGALGAREDLGVTDTVGVSIEPYTCAVRLSELGFKYVNLIAETTDVQRLLSPGSTFTLSDVPPADGAFGNDTRHRVDALG